MVSVKPIPMHIDAHFHFDPSFFTCHVSHMTTTCQFLWSQVRMVELGDKGSRTGKGSTGRGVVGSSILVVD
jgi:hypothetical protein